MHLQGQSKKIFSYSWFQLPQIEAQSQIAQILDWGV